MVSAFHGGSELFKLVRQKRRSRKARDQAQQNLEENQLQTSLTAGEKQIELRYTEYTRELGDLMRIGDGKSTYKACGMMELTRVIVIAHNRLYHIAVMLQAEVIKSLQIAATQ